MFTVYPLACVYMLCCSYLLFQKAMAERRIMKTVYVQQQVRSTEIDWYKEHRNAQLRNKYLKKNGFRRGKR